MFYFYNPSKFSMDNAWTSKPTCANMTLEIPTSNKHRTSDGQEMARMQDFTPFIPGLLGAFSGPPAIGHLAIEVAGALCA
jgi:hypothetical protein